MKLIKSLVCLMLASVTTVSAMEFYVDENTPPNKDGGYVVSSSSLISTCDFPLTVPEAAALSLTSILNTLTDEDTIQSVMSVMETLSVSGVDAEDTLIIDNTLSSIVFTEENSTNFDVANSIRRSILSLFRYEDGTSVDTTLQTAWGVSTGGIITAADASDTTVLALSSIQKLVIELARETPEFTTFDGSALRTLSLLGFDANSAYTLLDSVDIATENSTYDSLLSALRSARTRTRTTSSNAEEIADMMLSSSFLDASPLQRVSSILAPDTVVGTGRIGTIVNNEMEA